MMSRMKLVREQSNIFLLEKNTGQDDFIIDITYFQIFEKIVTLEWHRAV